MAIDGISSGVAGLSVAGVKAQNEQVRTLGAGFSQLLQGAAEIAGGAAAATSSGPAPSIDPNRGQTVDILA
ncbi:MAG: hypothetical protein RLO51_20625 [Thalassobaculum sp.]|uniref:hypothetical protein n=1 Tax=Thalassobaculum sp. TaxID=2022740 RepID=UPI0032ED007C